MRILITGASGLLGLNACLFLSEENHVIGVTHTQPIIKTPFKTLKCDLTEKTSLTKLLKNVKPDLVINCAALANIDSCETMPVIARQVNSVAPGNLASLCKKLNIKLVHISTDAVFDGTMGDYTEEDIPNPLSVYAATKLEGEHRVFSEFPEALIARVNFFGYSLMGKRSLAEFFLNSLLSTRQVFGFVDVMFNPLYVTDLVKVLLQMVNKNLAGLYHVVSPETLSKYAFALKIAETFGLDKSLIHPQSYTEAGLLAARSPRLSLKIDKLNSDDIKPPGQNIGIQHLYFDYLDKLPEKIKAFAA